MVVKPLSEQINSKRISKVVQADNKLVESESTWTPFGTLEGATSRSDGRHKFLHLLVVAWRCSDMTRLGSSVWLPSANGVGKILALVGNLKS